MRRIVACLLISFFLSACATTSYKKIDSWGYGYQETQLQPDVYRVDYEGSVDTDVPTVKDFALLRCAELTLQKGYKFFIILDAKSSTKVSVVTVPSVYQKPFDSYIQPSPYDMTTVDAFSEPSLSNTIQCFKEKPSNLNTLVYDAQKIQENIKSKHKLN